MKLANEGTLAAVGYIGHGADVNLGFAPSDSSIQCIIAQWCAPWLRQHAGKFASGSELSADNDGASAGMNNAISSVIDNALRIARV